MYITYTGLDKITLIKSSNFALTVFWSLASLNQT